MQKIPGHVNAGIFMTPDVAYFFRKMYRNKSEMLILDAKKMRWIRRPIGDGYHLRDIVQVSPREYWALGEKGKNLRTIDSGKQWKSENINGLEERILSIVSPKRNLLIACTEKGFLLKSANNGKKWVRTKLISNSKKYRTFSCNSLEFFSPKLGFIAGKGSKLFRTTDGGKTWTLQEIGIKQVGALKKAFDNKLWVSSAYTGAFKTLGPFR